MEAFQTTPAKRGLFLGLGVMVFQQFSGCNVVIFYATTIFNVNAFINSFNLIIYNNSIQFIAGNW